MSFNVNKLDVVFFQRKKDNSAYEQVNISGSWGIFYLDADGVLTAGSFFDLLKTQGTTKAMLQSYARPLVPGEPLYSCDTVNVGLPDRLVRYESTPNNTLSYRVIHTRTWTKDTDHGIGIGKTDKEPFVNATLDVSGTVVITGSLWVTGFMYGSASYALTSSYFSGSVGPSISSSYALTASYFSGSIESAISSSYALSASYSVTSSYADGAFIPYNGDRPIKRSGYIGLNVGGDDLEEFIENFFFPFIPATISINTTTLNYETGSQQTINLNGTLTPNDETLFYTGSVRKTGGIEVSGSFSGSSYSIDDVNVTGSYVYRTYYRVGYDGVPANISSSTKTVNFNYPYLYGTSSIENLTGSALYQALRKDFTSTTYNTNKTYNMIGVATYIYFAYPSGSKLISIKDPSSFEIYGSFQQTSSVAVTSSGLFSNWNHNYTVYRLALLADPGGNFSFYFT